MGDYPNIYKAALEMAYDNGGIHRDRTERQHRKELGTFLAKQDHDLLREIDAWLGTLTDEQISTVVAGEETEQQALVATAPPWTNRLLNDVC